MSAGRHPQYRRTAVLVRRARVLMLAFGVLAFVLASTADAQRRRKRRKKKKRRPPVTAPAARPTPAAKPSPAKGSNTVKKFDFSGINIGGQLRTPQLLYFLDRAADELQRASLERRSFIPEMVRSIDEEAL